MADDNTCFEGQCESPMTVHDCSDKDESSNSSDYLYITYSPGNSKHAELSAEFSDKIGSDNESDYQHDAFVEDLNNILTHSQPKISHEREVSEKLCRLKVENEILKEQLSQVIEIFDEEGCSTNIPIIQVSFSNHALAMNYKSDIEAYLCSLLTSDKGSDISDCEKESDNIVSDNPSLDRDIESPKQLFTLENSIDDDSCCSIPLYDNDYKGTLDNKPKEVPKSRPVASCFNCLGNHTLSKCPKKHDRNIISRNKTKYFDKQRSRSIPIDTRRARLFTAGEISNDLRKALGLETDQLPLHIYHMRILGYPPGWMKEAEIHDSDLKMYDSEGNIMLGDNESQVPDNGLPKDGAEEHKFNGEHSQVMLNNSEGNMEIPIPGNGSSKVKHDPSLLIDYPGFNIPTPIGYIDEFAELGMPGIQFHQLRCVTELKMTSPGKMPYRKRKLPSSAEIHSKKLKLDMDFLEDMETESLDMEIESLDNGEGRIIDSDDEDAQLCKFIPPLPREQPNHAPSPPPLPIPQPTFADDENVKTKGKDTLSELKTAVVKTEETTSLNNETTVAEEKKISDRLKKEKELANRKTTKSHKIIIKIKDGKNEEKQDELSSTSLKELEETKQKLMSELRNLWATSGNVNKKRHTMESKDASCRGRRDASCRRCRDTGCRKCRNTHCRRCGNIRIPKVKPKKEKKRVPRLILIGDSTCKRLCFDYIFTRKHHKIEIFTGDHWKLQTAMDHLKTKELIMTGNEILLVHLGINDFLLRQNGSLNEINKYAKRFIQQTIKKVKHLIISAILPSTFFSMTVNYKIQCTNVFIRELCKNECVGFINARKAFMANGALDKDFFQEDNFNLSSKGSEKLSNIFSSCFESAILRNIQEKDIKQEEDSKQEVFVEWF